jgi:hypothetical protein
MYCRPVQIVNGGTTVKILFVFTMYLVCIASFLERAQADDIKLSGDFRFRHEMIDEHGKDQINRERIRARMYFEGQVTPQAKVVIGISSGSSDPVSDNQTLTDAFSSKSLLIDVAFFEMTFSTVPGLKFLGGKMENPFYFPVKSELIWDSDIRPEGLAADYTDQFSGIDIRAITSVLWIEERKDGKDSYLIGGQAIATHKFNNEKGYLTAGVSMYDYAHIKGYPTFYDPENGRGNTVRKMIVGKDTVDVYAYDYDLFEFFTAFSYQYKSIPFAILFDYVANTAVNDFLALSGKNEGFLVGLHAGKIKNPGSWDCRYIYRELNGDAVVGIFTDSDFRGGGTNARGHEIGASYQLFDKTTLAATYFINQLEFISGKDYQRLQVDLKFAF